MGSLGVLGLGAFGVVWQKSTAPGSEAVEHALIAKSNRLPATRTQHPEQAQAAEILAGAYTSATRVSSGLVSGEATASIAPTQNAADSRCQIDT